MPTHLPRREAQLPSSHRTSPRMDGFGTWISIVVLVGAVTTAFVMRQNIDDHIYSAVSASHAATTGAVAHDQ